MFYGVGQGLFYSGSINSGMYNFVYDCGGKTNLVKKTINLLPPKLDFVAISHLHKDHINGIEELFKRCNITKVFLPYFDFKNYKNIFKSYIILNGIQLDSFAYKLLNMIYSRFDEDDEEILLSDNFWGALNDFDKQNEILKNNVKLTKFMVVKNFFSEHCFGEWNFRFFNYLTDLQKLKILEQEIKTLINNQDLEDYLRNTPNAINNIKKIYTKNFKDLNLTSLVLLHYSPYCCHSKQTLLCGDLAFNKELIYEICKYLRNDLILQAPHHGAKNEWFALCDDIKNISTKIIFSFGLNNRDHHPNSEILVDIIEKNWVDKICLVHEDKDFIYYVNG